MLRKRIELSSQSNPTTILAGLKDQCTAAGLSADETENVIAEVAGPLTALIQNGQNVASANGQFRASRQVVGQSAIITLNARFGTPSGVFRRLLNAISRRGAK